MKLTNWVRCMKKVSLTCNKISFFFYSSHFAFWNHVERDIFSKYYDNAVSCIDSKSKRHHSMFKEDIYLHFNPFYYHIFFKKSKKIWTTLKIVEIEFYKSISELNWVMCKIELLLMLSMLIYLNFIKLIFRLWRFIFNCYYK